MITDNIIKSARELKHAIASRRPYHPKSFWDNRADGFMQDSWQQKIQPQHAWMLKKLQESEASSILEIGCGFGRNITYFIDNDIDPKLITGLDISSKLIHKARSYINNHDVNLTVGDALNMPFENNSFDVIVVHGVCMHIKPGDIKKALQEALRVCKKYIISVEQNYEADNNYTFLHNYDTLFSGIGQIINKVEDNNIGLSYYYVKVR